jgi:hypothetical protein
VQVALQVDPTKLQGADNLGRPRLYTPNPVQPGSTGSHYRHGARAECVDGTCHQRFA